MSFIRTTAHARQAAPSFGALTDHEILKLRQLPAWVRWLYFELVAMSDFKTGMVRTSYAQLAALLDPDQPIQGGRRLEAPTLKQIRTALDWLYQLGLALRDRRGNERAGVLQIQVPGRAGFGAPKPEKGRGKGRVQSPENPDAIGTRPGQGVQLGQGLGQVVQEVKPLSLPSHVDKLSPGDGRAKARALSDQLRRDRTKKVAPPGGQTTAPAALAPVVPALIGIGSLLPRVDDQQAPPGGQDTAPAAHAPQAGAWAFPGAQPGSPAAALNDRMRAGTSPGLEGAKQRKAPPPESPRTDTEPGNEPGSPKSGPPRAKRGGG